MSGYFKCVFWPYIILRFRRLTLFDDSAETMPLLIVVAVEEAVAPTRGIEVAGDGIRAVVGCEFEKSVLRRRCV
jgi:hypothetical protein